MLLSKYLLLVAFLTVGYEVTTPSRIEAAPNQCAGGQFVVRFDGTETTTVGKKWKYTIIANQTSLNAFNAAVMIVPRPVSPQQIIPLAPTTYCTQWDTATKINTGNCNGFPHALTITGKTNKSLSAEITTSNEVTQGLVSLALVSGQATNDSCVNTDDSEPKGIPGPGALGDPFQPIFQEQTALVAGGKCLAKLIFDSAGQLADVQTLTPGCTVTVGDVTIEGQPLRNNTNPHGITWGNGTCTTYGPPIPSPARTVCR